LRNTGITDARDVRLTACAFDWLPYNEIEILGGNGATMYHCLAQGILIFDVGYLASGEEIVFFLSAQATRTAHWNEIRVRRITASGMVAVHEAELRAFYEWRSSETGRPGHVVAGDHVALAIVLQNTGAIDARDVVLRVCAFDWLPYNEMEIFGGDNITMYHCPVQRQLIFDVGHLSNSEEVIFFLSAQATESVHLDTIPNRNITFTASAAS